jgi:[ribosomal protein S5]-alanine N-acetyltransferase
VTGRWSIPLLTERLLLTPMVPADSDELLAMFREPMVRRYLLDDEPIERAWVDNEIAVSGERFAQGLLGLWVVRSRPAAGAARGEVVGFVGFRPFYDPPIEQLVYGITTRTTGVGLATEMTAAVVDHAFADPERREIRASTDEPNASSVRVLERLGFERVGRDPGERWAQLHFVRRR